MAKCKRRKFAYYIADSDQCDKYYKCEDGELTEELCPDGLVFDRESQSCFMMQRIDCKGRTKLRKLFLFLKRGNRQSELLLLLSIDRNSGR